MMRHSGQVLIALAAFLIPQMEIARAVEPGSPSVSRAALPSDVTAYVNRWTGCNHWAGEEAYDAERGRQIAAALRTLNCDRLDADEKRLRLRYQTSPDVGKALDGARDADG